MAIMAHVLRYALFAVHGVVVVVVPRINVVTAGGYS